MCYGFADSDSQATELITGNKGEWAEIYIFLKLLVDGKVFAADKNMQKIAQKHLKVLRLFREEIRDRRIEYVHGPQINVLCNGGQACSPLELSDVARAKDRVWGLISANARGTISDWDTQEFLGKMCITKLKAPADGDGFFGGTKDIVMEVESYNTGITSIVGFSCKSDFSAQATLFNASHDNTNFLFRIDGGMDDALAAEFNSMFDVRGEKQVVATARRMRLLKEHDCTLKFENAVSPSAQKNLRMQGGSEITTIIAEMLRHYYYDGEGTSAYSPISELVHWTAEQDVCEVGDSSGDIESFYWFKVSQLLYAMFTGLRLGKKWNGRSCVTGGYIVARQDGEVLAYHTCIADEFKDFLVQRLALEQPSHGRHYSMTIKKGHDNLFYIKLPLQIRFRAFASR